MWFALAEATQDGEIRKAAANARELIRKTMVPSRWLRLSDSRGRGNLSKDQQSREVGCIGKSILKEVRMIG